jgi:hypothetical protein
MRPWRSLNRLRRRLEEDETLDTKHRDDALTDIAAIEGQFKKEQLNKSAVMSLLNPVSKVAVIAELGLQLGELVHHLA